MVILTFFFSNIIFASTGAGADLWINSANVPPFKYFNRTTTRFYTGASILTFLYSDIDFMQQRF